MSGVLIGIVFFLIATLIGVTYYSSYNSNPFSTPHIDYYVDVSNHRRTTYKDCLEEWFIENHTSINILEVYDDAIKKWEKESQEYLNGDDKSWHEHRMEQYEQSKASLYSPDYKMFIFHYCETGAYGRVTKEREYLSLNEFLDINRELQEIGYETTRKKHFAKEQRRLMTKELRQKIIERDNYTCQICGKYMPDEVGLHVDHIVPISRGGTSVEDNLQVLCDKCNLGKSSNSAPLRVHQTVPKIVSPVIISEDPSELIKKFDYILEPLKELSETNKSYLDEKNRNDSLSFYIYGFISAFAITLLLIGLYAINQIKITSFILLFLIFCVIPFAIGKYYMNRYKESSASLEDLKKKVQTAKDKLHANDTSFIPVNYRDYNAVEFFYNALKNQRVSNMQDAIDLYEKEKHGDGVIF